MNIDDIVAAYRVEQLEPQHWSNTPGYRYVEHEHPSHKVLFCIDGSITFHLPDGDVRLSAGDRLDVPPHTRHAATVGPDGVVCLEAAKS